MKRAVCFLVATLICAMPSGSAWGYAMGIHEALTRRALPQGSGLLTPATFGGARLSDLQAFRRWFYVRAVSHPDEALRARFLKRYPTPQAFGALEFRELLAFNRRPSQRIWSIDRARSGVALDARELLAASASAPDRDYRNRDRIQYDPTSRRPVKDEHGRFIPDDPATLNMGQDVGLSSQAHAHYGLRQGVEFSDDPDVLKSEPSRFAIAAGYPEGPVLTLADEMAQLHTDLAILAHIWGRDASRYLVVTLVGQGWHYLQDVCNQIHTVQVGLYDFFVDAKLQYWWRAFVTSGGYLAELRKFTSIGIDILRNHHVLLEQLTEARFTEALSGEPTSPQIAKALEQLSVDDPDMSAQLDTALEGLADPAMFAGAIVRTLIEVSAQEGGEAYRLIRTAACGRVRGYGYKVPDDTDKRQIDYDTMVCLDDQESADALEALYGLQAKGFQRAGTAMRRFDTELTRVLALPDKATLERQILGRFLTARLDLLDAAEKRRAAWMNAPVSASGDVVREPVWPLAQAAFILMVSGLLWWRLRVRLPMPRYQPPEPTEAAVDPEEPSA